MFFAMHEAGFVAGLMYAQALVRSRIGHVNNSSSRLERQPARAGIMSGHANAATLLDRRKSVVGSRTILLMTSALATPVEKIILGGTLSISTRFGDDCWAATEGR